jgi:membrane-associated phospholipid phosphatase
MFLFSVLLTLLFVTIFTFLLVNINKSWLLSTDNRVSNFIIDNFRTKHLNSLFYYLDKIYIGIIIFLYFLFSIYYYRASPNTKFIVLRELLIWPLIFIVAPLIFVITSSSGIKHILKRKRPYIKPIKTYNSHSYSYPSIHAASSITIVTGLFFLVNYTLSLFNYYPQQTSIILLIIALIVCHVSICYSRIYLGVHYLSDVIGGTFFSLGLLGIFLSGVLLYYRV